MPKIRQPKTQSLCSLSVRLSNEPAIPPEQHAQPILRALRLALRARLSEGSDLKSNPLRLPALPRLKRNTVKPLAAPGCLRLLRIFERKYLQPFDFFRTFSRTNQRFDAAFRTFFVRKPQFSTLFCQKPAFYLTVFSLANRLFFPAVQGFCPFL